MAGKTTGRIITSNNAEKNIALAKSIYAKHKADGATSFLSQLEGAKWEEIGPTIAASESMNKKADDLKRQMEEAYRQRDALLQPIININNSSKKLLKGKYASNPKKLGDWGYDIDDTPPKPRAKKAVVPPAK